MLKQPWAPGAGFPIYYGCASWPPQSAEHIVAGEFNLNIITFRETLKIRKKDISVNCNEKSRSRKAIRRGRGTHVIAPRVLKIDTRIRLPVHP